MLTLKMVRGNWNSLDDPSSILISASAAKAYFGNEDPLNKMLAIDDYPVVKVTGVYEDLPRNSTFATLKFISTWELFYKNSGIQQTEDPWRPNFASLFVQLNDNADIDKVSARIRDAKLKKVNPQLAKKKPALFLFPMDKWHLYSEFKDGVNLGGAIKYVWMFGIIGGFVLLLACINFMNLSTARSEKRTREVGIRKTLGSLRTQLILQFFSESSLTVIFAFALSLLLVKLALPFFNDVSDKQIHILWSNPFFWIMSLAFIILTALVSGSYPAFYLSSFEPVKVLKGTYKAGRFASLPRKLLVVLQFTVSVSLIIGVITVYRQIQFAKDRPVGYTREGLVSVPLSSTKVRKSLQSVINELMNTGAVASVTTSGSPTTGIWNSTSGLSWKGKDPNLSIDFGAVNVSHDYGKTIQWRLKEGRDFSRDFVTDTSSMILSEAAVRFMGLKHPLGETVTWWGQPFTVIGVVNDMVMESPYTEPRTIIYTFAPNDANVAIIRIKPAATPQEAIAKISSVFKKFDPEQPFEFNFVDTEYARKFGDEERVGKLSSVFALLAVIISCLGLFGLASFVAEQRTKEIGVRKVLGASIFSVWNLLSKDFVRLVIISFFIAIPLSYYFMHSWLQNYKYRTTLSWWIFILAGAGALLITVLVVSLQAIRAATTNPVKSLRTE